MEQKTSVIITGASGLVGSRIVELLKDKFDFIPMGHDEGVDITDSSKVSEFIKTHTADVVLHLAAFTNTGEAENQDGDENGACFQINVVGTRNLALAARENEKHFIHFSTEYVFDGQKNEPYMEEDAPNPIGWYSKTKYFSEEEVKKSEVAHTIVRIAAPFRANYSLKPDIVHKMLSGIKNNTIAPMFDDTFITPTFVDDVAVGVGGLLDRRPQGIFNLTGNDFVSPYQLAQKVAKTFGLDPSAIKPGKSADYEKESGRKYVISLKVSNEKIKKFLGLELSIHDLDEALRLVKTQESL